MVQVQFWWYPIGRIGCGGDVCKLWCSRHCFFKGVIVCLSCLVVFVDPVVGERGHISSQVPSWWLEHPLGVYSCGVRCCNAHSQSPAQSGGVNAERAADTSAPEGAAYTSAPERAAYTSASESAANTSAPERAAYTSASQRAFLRVLYYLAAPSLFPPSTSP